MFGEKTFDEDSIKRYTKKQFFLPTRIEDWAAQLDATARFQDLLTCKDGIVFEGYRAALDFYDQNEQTCRTTFRNDKLMGVKMLYFLDQAFQEFATDLCRYVGLADPLRSAQNSLSNRQRNTVVPTLCPLKHGVKLTMSLPAGLMHSQNIGGGPNPKNHHNAGMEGGNGGGEGKGGDSRLKKILTLEGFKMPKGTKFGDYFNPRTSNGEQGRGWPQVPHDQTGPQETVCLRLTMTGKCPRDNCRMAHMLSEDLGQKNIDAMAT
jgi:hypothetical protein